MQIRLVFVLHFVLLVLVFVSVALANCALPVGNVLLYLQAYTYFGKFCFFFQKIVQYYASECYVAFSGCSNMGFSNTRNADVKMPNVHSITTLARDRC